MLDMETVRRHLVATLEADLPDTLAALDSGRPAPATPPPAVYLDYPIVDETLISWPVCLVLPRRVARTRSADGTTIRDYELDVEFWFADSEQAVLATWVERAAAAAGRVLERVDLWAPYDGFDPRVSAALYSNVLPSEGEFLRACRLNFAVSVVDLEED